jgi:protein TonB
MARPADCFGASASSPLWGCGILAVLVHAAVLSLGSHSSSVSLSVEGESVEVSLVASIDPGPPQAEPSPQEEKPPEKDTPEEPEKKEEPPPHQQDPPPEPPQKPAEIEEPPPQKPPEQKPVPRPPPARKSISPRSGPAGNAPSAGTQGSVQGAMGSTAMRPLFSYPPRPSYPAEARAAKEEGTVLIRMVVNADGRPTQVSVAKSSGFPRLDRSAQEAAWRCRIRNAAPGAQFDAPIVFKLRD